jgi:GMP synthase PP-ATPase subunit
MRTHMGIKLVTVDASKRFLDALTRHRGSRGKRRAIGTPSSTCSRSDGERRHEREVPRAGDAVPDVIESSSPTGDRP